MDYRKAFLERMEKAFYWATKRGARLNKAVVFAQAALESNWGRSFLTREANNLFGIKAGRSWKGDVIELPTWEWSKERGWYRTTARWRKYRSWQECLLDYYHLLETLPWFQDALEHLDNADEFLKAILPEAGEPGWATDPEYNQKVIRVAKTIEKLGYIEWK